jgi:hypothetical protein
MKFQPPRKHKDFTEESVMNRIKTIQEIAKASNLKFLDVSTVFLQLEFEKFNKGM